MSRRDARRRAARLCWIAAGGSLAGLLALALRHDHAVARELFAVRASGYVAVAALCLALATSPVAHLARRFAPGAVAPAVSGAFRRAFGITAACTALLHAGLVLTTWLGDAWFAALVRPFFRSGALALLILLALLATSFPGVVRRLRIQLWKELHWLAFPAAALMFHHLLLSSFAPRAWVLSLLAGMVAVGSLRFLPLGRPDS